PHGARWASAAPIGRILCAGRGARGWPFHSLGLQTNAVLYHTIASSRWLKRALGVGLVIAYPVQLLIGTTLGWLLCSFVIYLATPALTSVQPWSFGQLILWFDELGVEAKVGISSSLVTVLGFFIALQTTMHSWRRQTAASMRMSAADTIDRVVSEVNGLILQIEIFSEALAREVSRVRTHRVPLDAAPFLSSLSDDVIAFRAHRQRLLQLEQEILALPARYALLFMPLSDVPAALDAIAEQVEYVTKKIWVRTPPGGTEHPEHRRLLMESIDPVKFEELAGVCDSAHSAIAGLHGAARGVLLGPIIEMNPRAFLRTVRALLGKDED
ncbi:hypothetical protein, partial [Sphaerotilus sulfidivorans]